MKLLAFLGNPGDKYKRSRHNIGFIIGEYFCDTRGIVPSQKKFNSFCGVGKVDGVEVCALFPLTYMNASGDAVAQAAMFYKIAPSDIIVVHDEIEFPFGKTDVKFSGGHKGHNGVRSIVQRLGTGDFARLRFGVGRPEHPAISVADYVLGNFLSEEMSRIMEMLPDVSSLLAEEIKVAR